MRDLELIRGGGDLGLKKSANPRSERVRFWDRIGAEDRIVF